MEHHKNGALAPRLVQDRASHHAFYACYIYIYRLGKRALPPNVRLITTHMVLGGEHSVSNSRAVP